jgi:hypothetical protein
MRCEAAPVCSGRFRSFPTKATQQRARCARGAFTPSSTPIRASRIVSTALRGTLEGFSLLGAGHDGPHLAAPVDFMEVDGRIEPDPGADPIGRGEAGMSVGRITGRGTEVLREDAGWGAAPVLAARASDFPHIHPPRKLLSPPALRGRGNGGACGPSGPGLCGIVDSDFGERPFHALG